MTSLNLKSKLLVAVVVASGARADINVIPVYDGQAAYALAAREADDPDLEALAQRFVANPFLEPCSVGVGPDERAGLAERVGTPVAALELLLESAQELKRMETAARIEAFLAQASELLPLPADKDVTVCIEAWTATEIANQTFVKEVVKGVAGEYFGAGVIWISIRPYPGWFEQAKYVAPHEYHHVVRDVPESGTLLAGIVDEGLADAFVRELFDGWTPNSFDASDLDEREELRVWNEMLPYLDSDEEDIVMRYQFGSVYGAEDLPPIPGYTIGRKIVYAFLRNEPAIPIVEWTHLAAEDVYEKSGYVGYSQASGNQ